MALIIYPKGQLVYSRDSSTGAYTEMLIGGSPNTILYLDASGSLSSISASTLLITASYATSASYMSGSVTGLGGVATIQTISASAYAALSPPNANTLYIVV